MNTYLVPITAVGSVTPYDCILLVYANTPEEAYSRTRIKLSGRNIPLESSDYEYYPFELCTSDYFEYPFHESRKYDILNETFKHTEGYEYMAYFNVNWKSYTPALKQKAAKENWSNMTYQNDEILTNYIVNTYKKLQTEKNIFIADNYALFNTGLFTEDYELIYAYQTGNTIDFLTEYDLEKKQITTLPPRANYFDNPDLLLFDPQCKINVQYKHILSDPNNIARIPVSIRNAKNLLAIFIGSIEITKMKVAMNYKLAVPQYFNDQIQLLLPLYLLGEDEPDLVLAVTKVGDHYQGHTCLTLDMAYNNARLIAKPESNWLTNN